MNSLLSSWKTSLAGVAAGALLIAANTYQSGMTWKSWGAAVAIALMGILSKDHNVTGGTTTSK